MSWKSITVNTICGLIVALGLVGIGTTYHHNQTQKSYADKLSNKVNQSQTEFNAIKYQQSTTKYVISPKGKISQTHIDTMHTITNVFGLATTWKNGNQYNQHRSQLRQYVSDNSFFAKSGLMNNQTDSSGNSALDQNGVKSKNVGVTAYATNGNQYLVIVNNIFYHNNYDLQLQSQLKTTTSMFIVGGTGEQLNYIHEIPNINTVSQLTGL